MSIAVAIVLLASLAVLDGTKALARSMQSLQDRERGESTLGVQVQRWKSEASSALAVTLPDDPGCSGNVTGLAASPSNPLRVDFYTKTNATDANSAGGISNGVWITYQYDGTQLTREVFTLDANGNPQSLSKSTVALDSLTAQCIRPTTLNDPALQNVSRSDVEVRAPVALPGHATPSGGNFIVELTAKTKYAARTIRLTSGTSSTGVIVEGPQWHTVVWREDHTRRFYIPPFFTGQRSWIRVMVRVNVSWDNWAHESKWCEWEPFEFYSGTGTGLKFDRGSGPGGTLTQDDRNRGQVTDVWAFSAGRYPQVKTPPLGDLLPDHLMAFCRDNPGQAGSTTGTHDPPGPTAPPGGSGNPPDNQDVQLPPYFIWQHCHTGTTWSWDPSTCNASSFNPNDVMSCDPNNPWSCTVSVPSQPDPSQPDGGWGEWCAAYSGTSWSSTNPPYYNGPDSRCARPTDATPTPRPSKTPHPICKNPPGPPGHEKYVTYYGPIDPGNPGDPICICPPPSYDDGSGTCVTDGSDPSPAPTPAPSYPPVTQSGSWLQDCRNAINDRSLPADTLNAAGDPTLYPWTDPRSQIPVLLNQVGTDFLYVLEPASTGGTDGNGNTIYTTQYACVARTS